MGTTTTSSSDPEHDHAEQARTVVASPSARPSGAFGRVLRAIALAILMAGLGYVAGRVHGNLDVDNLQAQLRAANEQHQSATERSAAAHHQALTSAQTETEHARSERAQLADLILLYDGYRLVQQALGALDARNFGIAEERLRDAEKELAPAAPRLVGVPQLLTQIANTKIVVAGNLDEQRQAVAALVRALDKLIEAKRTVPGTQ